MQVQLIKGWYGHGSFMQMAIYWNTLTSPWSLSDLMFIKRTNHRGWLQKWLRHHVELCHPESPSPRGNKRSEGWWNTRLLRERLLPPRECSQLPRSDSIRSQSYLSGRALSLFRESLLHGRGFFQGESLKPAAQTFLRLPLSALQVTLLRRSWTT